MVWINWSGGPHDSGSFAATGGDPNFAFGRKQYPSASAAISEWRMRGYGSTPEVRWHPKPGEPENPPPEQIDQYNRGMQELAQASSDAEYRQYEAERRRQELSQMPRAEQRPGEIGIVREGEVIQVPNRRIEGTGDGGYTERTQYSRPEGYNYHGTKENPAGLGGYGTSWNMPTEINPETGKRWTEPAPKYGIQHLKLGGSTTVYDFWTPELAKKGIQPDRVYRTDIFGSAYVDVGKADLPKVDKKGYVPLYPLENPITPKLEQGLEMAMISPFFVKFPSIKGLKSVYKGVTEKPIDPMFIPIPNSMRGFVPKPVANIVSNRITIKGQPDVILKHTDTGILSEFQLSPNAAKLTMGDASRYSNALKQIKSNFVYVATPAIADAIQPQKKQKTAPSTFHTIRDVQKSVFGSAPLMPGNRLLGQMSGLGNKPIMPSERLAEMFLPATKENTFIVSSKKGTYFAGKTTNKKSKGAGFSNLQQKWEQRAKENAVTASKGFTRTRQGQIVLQKQEVKQVTKQTQQSPQKQIEKEITKAQQATQQKFMQKFFMFTPQAERTKNAQVAKSRAQQINYISPVERMMGATKTTQRTRTAQKTRTGLIEKNVLRELQKSASAVIAIPKEMQRTKEAQKEMQRTKGVQRTKEAQIFRPLQIQAPVLEIPDIFNEEATKTTRRKHSSWKLINPFLSLFGVKE